MSTERPRVLVLPSWYPPGGGWFFRDQAHALVAAGAEVAVAYPRPLWWRQIVREPSRVTALFRGCEYANDAGVASFRRHWPGLPTRGRLEPAEAVHCARRVYGDVLRRWGRPDLVHAHGLTWGGFAASTIAREYGVPYVVTEPSGRYSLAGPEADPLLPPWQEPYMRRALEGARAVLMVGSHLSVRLGPLTPPDVPLLAMPYGVDTGFFAPGTPGTPGETGTRGTPGVQGSSGAPGERRPAGPFTFAFVGFLNRQKGVHTLLEAFARVRETAPATRLVFVGDGPERSALMEASRRRELASQVEFAGHQDQAGVRYHLARADVCVLPSDYEGLPVSLCEAMSMGLPVVATEGAPPELCAGYAGVRTVPRDAGSLARGMAVVMDGYAAFDRARIRAFAVETYDARVIAHRLLGVYRQHCF